MQFCSQHQKSFGLNLICLMDQLMHTLWLSKSNQFPFWYQNAVVFEIKTTNKIWFILEPILISNSVSQNKIKKLDVILIQFWYQFDIKLHPTLILVIDIKCSSNLKQIRFISDIHNWSHLGTKSDQSWLDLLICYGPKLDTKIEYHDHI